MAAVRIPADDGRIKRHPQDSCKPQAGGANHAGKWAPVPGEKEVVDPDDRQQSSVSDLPEPNQETGDQADQSGVGCGYHIYPFADGVCLPGRDHGLVFPKNHRVGTFPELGGGVGLCGVKNGH